mgnify:CR=1 FL=1
MLLALEGALDELDRGQGHTLVIHSALEAGFSAGADLRELYGAISGAKGPEQVAALACWLDRIHSVMDRLDTLP